LMTTPDQSSELASGLPKSKLVMMEYSGHFPFFEENYMFTEWVRQFMIATNSSVNAKIASGPVTTTLATGRR
jgi:hypothetical protein